MRKLKAGVIKTPHNEGMSFDGGSDSISVEEGETEFYLKSEADKVIAELKKERDWLAKDRAQAYNDLEKRAQLNIKQEESNRHNKYKRCLAMAMWCFTKSNYHFHLARSGEDVKENIRKDAFYTKWRYRWLKIAEKFKEDK